VVAVVVGYYQVVAGQLMSVDDVLVLLVVLVPVSWML
jgi:hypothetical protein